MPECISLETSDVIDSFNLQTYIEYILDRCNKIKSSKEKKKNNKQRKNTMGM